METYIDKSYAVTGKTIVGYYGDEEIVRIPAQFGDIRPERIGEGAFYEAEHIKQVVLPRGIRSIGKSAFAECKQLSAVYIPGTVEKIEMMAFSQRSYQTTVPDIVVYDFMLTKSEYESLKGNCLQTANRICVAREYPAWPIAQQIKGAVSSSHAVIIPDGTPVLFLSNDIGEDESAASLERNLACYHFKKAESFCTENAAFYDHMMAGYDENELAPYEKANDLLVRANKFPSFPKVMIFTFDDAQTRLQDGKYAITGTIKTGYFFRQSAKRVRCIGKDYYVYRRYYLTSDTVIKLARRDVAVYFAGRPVKNRKEAEQVYAKYKLLSIL